MQMFFYVSMSRDKATNNWTVLPKVRKALGSHGKGSKARGIGLIPSLIRLRTLARPGQHLVQ